VPRKARKEGRSATPPLAGGAIDLAWTIPLIIPRPSVHTLGNRGLERMAATIALPCVGREPHAARGHIFGHEVVARLPVLRRYRLQGLLAVLYTARVQAQALRRDGRRPVTIWLERDLQVTAGVDRRAMATAIGRLGWRV
jgi:hypothetical protein